MLFACFLLSASASSLAQTFACQFVAAAGLNWENGSWVTKTFIERNPFFISLNPDGQTIDKKSIAQLVPIPTCAGEVIISCSGAAGAFLSFSPSALKGAYALTLGSVTPDKERKDSIMISPFICQKM